MICHYRQQLLALYVPAGPVPVGRYDWLLPAITRAFIPCWPRAGGTMIGHYRQQVPRASYVPAGPVPVER